MATAAERFTKRVVTSEIGSTTATSSVGKVDIIDDANVEEESFATFSEADVVKVDVLMPLIPGRGTDDYENVFALPKDDDDEIPTSASKKGKEKKPKVTHTHLNLKLEFIIGIDCLSKK